MTGQTLDSRGLEPLNQVPIHGFINGIAVGPKARFCVIAAGQEHRLGRWNRVPRAKNRFGIVKLYNSSDDIANSEDDEAGPVNTDTSRIDESSSD